MITWACASFIIVIHWKDLPNLNVSISDLLNLMVLWYSDSDLFCKNLLYPCNPSKYPHLRPTGLRDYFNGTSLSLLLYADSICGWTSLRWTTAEATDHMSVLIWADDQCVVGLHMSYCCLVFSKEQHHMRSLVSHCLQKVQNQSTVVEWKELATAVHLVQ